MKVPFFDLGAGHQELRCKLDAAYQRVLEAGSFVMGRELDAFEREFAQYCGAEYCIGVGSGLDALHFILRALDIGQGDEVVVPSNTFIATWLAVTHAGARPVPVEPIYATYNIDPSKIAAAITPRTKAIIAVHLYGQPADMEPILSVASQYGLPVIEDAAQAHGAEYCHKRAGALGYAAAFSFYPGKNLGALGDGGSVVTADGALAEKVRKLSNYGASRKYRHDKIGFNSRLDELQAAFLRAKLTVADEWNGRRQRIAAHYTKRLANSDLILPGVHHSATPVWHLFVVRVPQREYITLQLTKRGIDTLIHYPIDPACSGAYASLGYQRAYLPIARTLSQQVLSLPIGPHICLESVDYVCDTLLELLDTLR
ncbi:DegT/DnrJ/EryC1/StrS family aminotransferase [Mycetohabitans endofungorum]|uniref:DegT/DnrJ/EryC1/StrS family aminotransferase n=1 Tax=Mycetohabitans endofungorum TaxID=417203 RepID=UPI0030CAC55C